MFSIGKFDVADEVGIGFFYLWRWPVWRQKNCVSAFNSFVGETGFTSTLCQAEKNVGGGNLPGHFLRTFIGTAQRKNGRRMDLGGD